MSGPMLRRHHWRKALAWAALTRPVAALFSGEREVADAFRGTCVACDEHYLATMLAAYGWGNRTSCSWGTTYTSFVGDPLHGHSDEFGSGELRGGELLPRARRAGGCQSAPGYRPPEALQAEARGTLLDVRDLVPGGHAGLCERHLHTLAAAGYSPMSPKCNVFMRKVAADASADAEDVLAADGVL